ENFHRQQPVGRMFGLLRFPNLAKPLVTGLALTDLANLRVEIFEALALRVRWNFNRALLRHERDLIISVLVGRAVEHRSDPLADGHVVGPPIGIEQVAIPISYSAIRERDQQ